MNSESGIPNRIDLPSAAAAACIAAEAFHLSVQQRIMNANFEIEMDKQRRIMIISLMIFTTTNRFGILEIGAISGGGGIQLIIRERTDPDHQRRK